MVDFQWKSYQNSSDDSDDVEMAKASEEIDDTPVVVMMNHAGEHGNRSSANSSFCRRNKRVVLPVVLALVLFVAYIAFTGGTTSTTAQLESASANVLGSATMKATKHSSSDAVSGAGPPPSEADMPDWNDSKGQYDWQKCLNADDDGCWKQEGKRVGSFWEDFGHRMDTFWKSVGDWFKSMFGGGGGATTSSSVGSASTNAPVADAVVAEKKTTEEEPSE
jgi:hypothetical protein